MSKIYQILPSEDGQICVKQIMDGQYSEGSEYVKVTMNNDKVESAVKMTAADLNKPAAPEVSSEDAAASSNKVTPETPLGETNETGGFSMKSLSRKLFGSKKSKRRLMKKNRSIRKSKRSVRGKRK